MDSDNKETNKAKNGVDEWNSITIRKQRRVGRKGGITGLYRETKEARKGGRSGL